MKKLLNLLLAIGLISGVGSTTVSCGKKQQNPNIEKPKPPTKEEINLDEIIKNKYLGTILHKTKPEILKAIKDKNKDLIEEEIDINSIYNDYAIIEAKKDSQIYNGSVKVIFSLETRLEKLTIENNFISNLGGWIETDEQRKKRMLIYFVCANWPITNLYNYDEINNITNKLTIEYCFIKNENWIKATIEPKEGVKEYSGSVKVTFYKLNLDLKPGHEDYKSNLAYIFDLPQVTRIGKPNDFKEETILSMISKVETDDHSICKGKPIDISKINIKLAKNKLSVIVEPKKDINNQIYNGIVRFWFAKSWWND